MARKENCTIYLRINLNVTPCRAEELTHHFQGIVQKEINRMRFTHGGVDSSSYYVVKGNPVCQEILRWSNVRGWKRQVKKGEKNGF